MIISVVHGAFGGWRVKRWGAKQNLKSFVFKKPAIKFAKEIAKEKGLTLEIYSMGGLLQGRITYRRVIK